MEEINILSFDTSQDDLKVGLSIDNNYAFCDKDTGLKHIENLLPQIEYLFKSINQDKSKLKFAGVCTGPGSFTGIRIGIAAAYGLSFEDKINCFGFSVFDVYKYLYKDKNFDVVIPIIDAKKQRFYCAFIEKNAPVMMQDITPEEIIDNLKKYQNKKIIFTGKDFKILQERINLNFNYQYEYENGYSAKDIIDYSKFLILSKSKLEYPKPIYLRKSEAEIELLKTKSKT